MHFICFEIFSELSEPRYNSTPIRNSNKARLRKIEDKIEDEIYKIQNVAGFKDEFTTKLDELQSKILKQDRVKLKERKEQGLFL